MNVLTRLGRERPLVGEHHDTAFRFLTHAFRPQAMLLDKLVLQAAQVRILRRQLDGLAAALHPDHRILSL